MNLIGNGIKEVLKVERVITETELYFLVTYKDYYHRDPRTGKFMDIKDLENKSWRE